MGPCAATSHSGAVMTSGVCRPGKGGAAARARAVMVQQRGA